MSHTKRWKLIVFEETEKNGTIGRGRRMQLSTDQTYPSLNFYDQSKCIPVYFDTSGAEPTVT